MLLSVCAPVRIIQLVEASQFVASYEALNHLCAHMGTLIKERMSVKL